MALPRNRALDRAMASAPVRHLALATSSRRLRVLAYHGVDDVESLDAQLSWVVRNLRPVTMQEVIDDACGRCSLPARAVWVTFDDGDPSVVRDGLPILRRHGIRATMFVCPAVIGTPDALWWQRFDDPAEIGRLKTFPDHERRARVEAQPARPTRQLSVDELRAFADAGDVGNHTWDHPMLDQCPPDEQRRQVRLAHEWLTSTLGHAPRAIAYPNGNHAAEAELEARALGYEIGVLHDHRLSTPAAHPLTMSRLRTSDRQSIDRFVAVVSGVHPTVHRLRQRAARWRRGRRSHRA